MVCVRPLRGDVVSEDYDDGNLMGLRIVDENVELAAGEIGDFISGGGDAVLVCDVELDGAHAHGGEFLEDVHVARRSNDMAAYE